MQPSPDTPKLPKDPDTPDVKLPAEDPPPLEILYPCVGVCMSDPETGICLGCGRPSDGDR